ncbi:MAG: HD domain-containing protein [Treponema sp.]|nr:HD domain-containing protein [Treponema sp.]
MFSSDRIRIPDELVKVNKIFNANGFKAYLVGGAVRDIFMGREGHDWDLATDATPQQIMKIFRSVIPTGIAHGTVTIRIFGHELETTTFRSESDYSDGRHPDSVTYAKTIEEDLARRDFTMNAIAASLSDGRIVDPHGGRDDIRAKLIRTVGNPLERFNEDGLRPVRAVRFAAQLGFSIEENTLKALSNDMVLKKVASVSVERFRDEWCKTLLTPHPSPALRLLEESGMLELFIPEFSCCRNCTQKDARGFHEFDVADHLLYAVDGSRTVDFPHDSLAVTLAAFYHDIGKPEAREVENVGGTQIIHFHGHEEISQEKARASMTRLKFPKDTITKVCHLVKEHMFHYEEHWSDAAVRRFIIRVGREHFTDLLALRLSDNYGQHNMPMVLGSPAFKLLVELQDRVKKVQEEEAAFSLKDLAVNGNDLMALGIPAGKEMGAILKELFETVTDSPAMNTKEKLLPLAESIHKKNSKKQ